MRVTCARGGLVIYCVHALGVSNAETAMGREQLAKTKQSRDTKINTLNSNSNINSNYTPLIYALDHQDACEGVLQNVAKKSPEIGSRKMANLPNAERLKILHRCQR